LSNKNLTGEEDIHVVYNFVLEDNQQAESEEGGILQDHIENNAPNIYSTTAVLATVCMSKE